MVGTAADTHRVVVLPLVPAAGQHHVGHCGLVGPGLNLVLGLRAPQPQALVVSQVRLLAQVLEALHHGLRVLFQLLVCEGSEKETEVGGGGTKHSATVLPGMHVGEHMHTQRKRS